MAGLCFSFDDFGPTLRQRPRLPLQEESGEEVNAEWAAL
jgi:hypothetical protein